MKIADYLELRTSHDLIHWSEPIKIEYEGKVIGSHYNGIEPYDVEGNPFVSKDNKLTLIYCHNGTDVLRYDLTIE